jgi:WD40 repeat protein
MSAEDKAASQRSDVFISYSRKDREFVRRLEEALESRGRETWVDWQGIRPAEEFMQAIFPAIEGTDTFVFVISPDSVNSEICGRELAHAVTHNKRMIPIMARETEATAVPEPLAKLNWVFARDADSFEAATDFLISALDTDLGWVRAHTRLLTRALEWEAKAKSNSFVLRGEDLRAAEQWLAQAGTEKERQPTALQTEYIIASRKASSKRQRITLGAVSFGLVLAIVLAVLALIQRGKAIRQKEAALSALSQSDFAQAMRLIADQRATEALAYLARAVRTNGNPAAASRIGSLFLERLWPMPLESPHTDAVRTFLSPTGAHAVVVLADGSAEIRDNVTARALSPRIQLQAGVDAARFSPDGARVVLAGDSEKEGVPIQPVTVAIQLWDVKNGRAMAEPVLLEEGGVREEMLATFSADSRYVALLAGYGKIIIWDAQTGRELRRVEADSEMQFSRDGERLVIMRQGTAQVLETRTGKPIGAAIKLSPDLQARAVALSPDGLSIAMSGGEDVGLTRVWEIATGKPVTPPMEQGWVNQLEFSPGGQWLLTLGDREARVWDARTGKPVTGWLKNPGAERLSAASFSADGQRLVTVAEGNGVCLWEVATGAVTLQSIEIPGVITAHFSRDGQRLITGGPNGVSRQVWDLARGSASPLSLLGSTPVQHEFMLATFQSGAFQIRDIRSGNVLLESALEQPAGATEPDTPNGTFSADGRRFLVSIEKNARVWDLPSGKELPKPVARVREMTRDGSKFLSTDDDKSVKIWETESGRTFREIKLVEGSYVDSAAFSPNGGLVAITSHRVLDNAAPEGYGQLWDVRTGQTASPVVTYPWAPIVSFSPDRTRLVIVSQGDNGTSLLVWKLPGGEPVGKAIEMAEMMLGPAEDPLPPIFSPDSQRFILLVGQAMRLFETASGKLIDSPPMRRDTFTSARFSADGKLFVTTGNAIQVWNATTGLPLIDPVKPPATFTYDSVEFSADGRRLLAAGIGRSEGKWGNTGMLDAATGAAIADSHKREGPWHAAHFSPDDLLVVEESNPVRVWDIAPPGEGPAWLADLAEAVSGCVLTTAGTLEIIPDRAKRLAALRQRVAELPADDRWAQVARWFLAEPHTRTVSPYSTVRVADYIERCVKENTVEKLQEALAASPADPLAHANFGLKLLELNDSQRHALVRADGETLLATQLAPQNAAVWQARAKVLTALKRPTEAAAATKMAAELSRP